MVVKRHSRVMKDARDVIHSFRVIMFRLLEFIETLIGQFN